LEERSNGKGKLAEASEEGQVPRRAVEPMMMVVMIIITMISVLIIAKETYMTEVESSSPLRKTLKVYDDGVLLE
jgi:hypothetical protein